MSDSSLPSVGGTRGRRFKHLAIGAAIVVVFLAVLVAMLPTFISLGLFRGTITGEISGRVQGTVVLEGLSVGWSGPLEVKRLRVEDAERHSSVEVSLTLDQGLWTLLTEGAGTLSGSVSAKVATRLEPDGTLAMARMVKPAPVDAAQRPVPGAPPRDGTGRTTPQGVVPAGFHAVFTLAALDVEIANTDGTPHAAVTGVTGKLDVHAGGKSGLELAGSAVYQGNRGSFQVSASADKIIGADGTLQWKGVPATLDVQASNIHFSAEGVELDLDSLMLAVKSADLTGPTDATVALKGSVNGATKAALEGTLSVARTLAPDGAVAVDLGGVRGSIVGTNLPTAPLQRFLAETPVVLARDVGPTMDVRASFADATGRGISIALESEQIQATAEGSVDAATQAATLMRVSVKASVHPVIAEIAGLDIASRARITLDATDVTVPARQADGAFPTNAVAFRATVAAELPGAAVRVEGERRALGIEGIELTASAAPIGSGVTFDVRARAPGAASAQGAPLRVTGMLVPGGQFGVHGKVAATAVPAALVDPWVASAALVRVADDLGPTIESLEIELGAGETAPFRAEVRAAFLAATVNGTQAADGSVAIAEASLMAPRVRPALLERAGVRVDAPVRVEVRAQGVTLPPVKQFSADAVRGAFTVAVRPQQGTTVVLQAGAESGPGARTVQFTSLDAALGAQPLGTEATFDTKVVVDGVTLVAKGSAKGLMTAGDVTAWQSAVYDATLQAGPIAAAQVVREVPALKDIAPAIGSGSFNLSAAFRGTLQGGRVEAALAAGGAKASATVALAERSAEVTADATVPVTRALLAALVADAPIVLGAPATAHATVSKATLARTGLWEFAPPQEAVLSLRVPELTLREVEGLDSSVRLDAVALDTTVSLAVPMAARGTLGAAVWALGAKSVPVRAADVAIEFTWKDRVASQVAGAPGAAGTSGAAGAPGAAGTPSAGGAAARQTWDALVRVEKLNGPGLEELLGAPADARGQIGSAGTARIKATQSATGALAFEVDSQVDRLRASLRGDLTDGVLTLQPSELDLNIPGPQVVALLNGLNEDGKKTWVSAEALAVQARVQSLRLRVGSEPQTSPSGAGGIRDAGAGGAGGATSAGAAAVPDAPPSIRLPPGFSAVVNATIHPITLTPTEGVPLRLQQATLEVGAPGVGQPATLSARMQLSAPSVQGGSGTPAAGGASGAAHVAGGGSSAGAGAGAGAPPASADLVVQATVTEWTKPDGSVAFDTLQVNGRATATRASTALLGALLGMGSELTEAVGPELTADARVTSTGPGTATINASLDSEYLVMRGPRIQLKDGFVSVEPEKPVTVRFLPSEPLRERYLEPINPVFTDVRMATPAQRIVLAVSSARYPLDRDFRKLDADLDLTIGPVLMQRNPNNQLLNLLKVFQSQGGQPVAGQIDPLVVNIRKGQLSYQKFNVFLEKQGNTWVTQLIFAGDIDLTQTPAYARAIAANYPMSSVARQMLSNVPAEDGGAELQSVFGLATGALNMVQLRISFSGALGEVDGKPMALKRKIKVDFKPSAGVGEVIQGAGDIFRGIFDKKQNTKPK